PRRSRPPPPGLARPGDGRRHADRGVGGGHRRVVATTDRPRGEPSAVHGSRRHPGAPGCFPPRPLQTRRRPPPLRPPSPRAAAGPPFGAPLPRPPGRPPGRGPASLLLGGDGRQRGRDGGGRPLEPLAVSEARQSDRGPLNLLLVPDGVVLAPTGSRRPPR